MKYLKKYKELNEGLRDMMKPKPDEVVYKKLEDKTTVEKLHFIRKYKLDKKFMPSEEEINEFLKDLSNDDKIETIFLYNLNYDLLPRNDRGWCIYKGTGKVMGEVYCVGSDIIELPNKLSINGDFHCSKNNIEKFPPDFIVSDILLCMDNKLKEIPSGLRIKKSLFCQNNQIESLPRDLAKLEFLNCQNNKLTMLPSYLSVKELDCSNNMIRRLPVGLRVDYDLVCNDNKISELPSDLIVGGILYIHNNPISKDIKKPKGVNKISFDQ